MTSVCVSMLLAGNSSYFRSGKQAIRSIFDNCDFDIFLTADRSMVWKNNRIQLSQLNTQDLAQDHRAQRFLLKFIALHHCLQSVDAEWIICMDADTLLLNTIDLPMVKEALNGKKLGMVEQTGIQGSNMTRIDFREHYKNHSLAWLDRDAEPPAIEDFRYFNSGVVIGHRSEFEKLVPWALDTIGRATTDHQVGQHMIADQDYFQFWANNLHPGSCTTLSWDWNHCEHWDAGFPRPEARILHFSNFCRGPNLRQTLRMFYLRKKSFRRKVRLPRN